MGHTVWQVYDDVQIVSLWAPNAYVSANNNPERAKNLTIYVSNQTAYQAGATCITQLYPLGGAAETLVWCDGAPAVQVSSSRAVVGNGGL